MNNIILQELNQASKVLNEFISNDTNIQSIEKGALLMIESLKKGGKIISCGNGGSMADAIHFAEELTGKFREDRKPISALAISDSGYISCVSNDFGYDQIFARFVEGVGREEDVLLAISTSGNSENVIRAAEKAQRMGMKVVALSGKDGGKLSDFCDVEICVNHNGYADRIQEIHIKVIHILIQLIEKGL